MPISLRHTLIWASLGVILASCSTPTAGPQIPPVVQPCPSEGLAPVVKGPTQPTLSEEERGRVFLGIATAIDPTKAQALVRYWEAELPSWAKLGWDRVAKTKAWCDRR